MEDLAIYTWVFMFGNVLFGHGGLVIHGRLKSVGHSVVGYFWCGSRAALYRKLQQGLLLPVFLVRVKAQHSARFALGFISYGRSCMVSHLWSAADHRIFMVDHP